MAIDNAPPATGGTTPPSGPPQVDGVTASGASRRRDDRLSRKLTDIDRDLRARLHTAANAAMQRQLERAGAKLRTKVARDETLRTRIAQRPNERVASILGPDVVTAAGLTPQELLGGDWTALRGQFMQWTETAQAQALKVALKLAGITDTERAAQTAQQSLADGRNAGWDLLEHALTTLSTSLLYQPDPNATGEINPSVLVPTGTIRAALAVAGGTPAAQVAVDEQGAVTTSGFVGQVGTGQAISELLQTAGGTTDEWEWNHASTVQDPFEPHLELDGTTFESFTADALANNDGYPDNAYYFPGDHQGCTCDAMPLWSFAGSPVNDSEQES